MPRKKPETIDGNPTVSSFSVNIEDTRPIHSFGGNLKVGYGFNITFIEPVPYEVAEATALTITSRVGDMIETVNDHSIMVRRNRGLFRDKDTPIQTMGEIHARSAKEAIEKTQDQLDLIAEEARNG